MHACWCGLAALLAIGAAALTADAATPTHKVRMYWNFGSIDVELYGVDAPRHVANFLRYANADLYDNTLVHRVQAGSARFVQGGGFYVSDPFLVETLIDDVVPSYADIDNEFDASNGLSNIEGSLAAARSTSPDSATNQWFFNITDNSGGFDPGPYTVYGQITAGLDWFDDVPYLAQLQQLFPETTGSYESTTPLAYVSSQNAYFPIVLIETVEISLQPGDFNFDGVVDAADELVWQAGQGDLYGADPPPPTLNLAADADGDADVDADDLAIWQANQGQGSLVPDVQGDFNRDGVVTEADYFWWETTIGSTRSLYADANGDSIVSLADYTLWRDAWGGSTVAAIPEPAALATVCLAGVLGGGRRARR